MNKLNYLYHLINSRWKLPSLVQPPGGAKLQANLHNATLKPVTQRFSFFCKRRDFNQKNLRYLVINPAANCQNKTKLDYKTFNLLQNKCSVMDKM